MYCKQNNWKHAKKWRKKQKYLENKHNQYATTAQHIKRQTKISKNKIHLSTVNEIKFVAFTFSFAKLPENPYV